MPRRSRIFPPRYRGDNRHVIHTPTVGSNLAEICFTGCFGDLQFGRLRTSTEESDAAGQSGGSGSDFNLMRLLDGIYCISEEEKKKSMSAYF